MMEDATPSQRGLRILCVVNLPWDARLGASRVWIELAEEWRRAGHSVGAFCLPDAFPNPTKNNALNALRQVWFARRAARFIRKHAANYDVIDALLGTVPYAKSRLNFRGLLVARSVGFYRLYEKFEREARQRWPTLPRGKIVGRMFYTFVRRRAVAAAEASIRCADLVNLPNEDELKSLREEIDKPTLVQPYGLSLARQENLGRAARPAAERLGAQRVVFIGMWISRKGAKDWGELARRIYARVPAVKFRFLGTLTPNHAVLRDLGAGERDQFEIIAEYQPDALPDLLADCTVGVFPSYAEGFGLAVLEQLAAGLPVVAYDAPGPRQILNRLQPERLLVPIGDITAIADRAAAILQSSRESYTKLNAESMRCAAGFAWPEIAATTIVSYRERLRALNLAG
jgi:glycosyltransferase involved in cell wall biosynthesis